MENTLAFIQTCLSRFVKFGSRVVEGGLPLFFVRQNWPAHPGAIPS